MLSEEQLRNSIRMVTCDHDTLCRGYRWEIRDQAALAHLVAWTLSGRYLHAERVLSSLEGGPPPTWETVRQAVIAKLRLPPRTGNVTARWHRDGLVFQHIAWIAAHTASPGAIASSTPHMIKAHKGFDALLVPLGRDRRADAGIVICEEKATIHPRNEITNKVWPAVVSAETGEQDAELTAELTTILLRYNVANLDEILAAAHWRNRKSYRVSITIPEEHEREAKRRALFEGFDQHARGDLWRRRAETLTLANMRDWMEAFSNEVIEHIEGEDVNV